MILLPSLTAEDFSSAAINAGSSSIRSQRWNEQRQAVQPMIKILAKFVLPHLFEERAIGGANDPRVGMQHLLRTEPLKLAVFEHSQDFHLCEWTHIGDLVEKYLSFASSNFPLTVCWAPFERAALVFKELAFDQHVAHGRGVKTKARSARAEEL